MERGAVSGELAMRDMDIAMETASACRERASELRQLGFGFVADEMIRNARGAERWLVNAAAAYPRRCSHDGRPVCPAPPGASAT